MFCFSFYILTMQISTWTTKWQKPLDLPDLLYRPMLAKQGQKIAKNPNPMVFKLLVSVPEVSNGDDAQAMLLRWLLSRFRLGGVASPLTKIRRNVTVQTCPYPFDRTNERKFAHRKDVQWTNVAVNVNIETLSFFESLGEENSGGDDGRYVAQKRNFPSLVVLVQDIRTRTSDSLSSTVLRTVSRNGL
jgi:hypothetical protein